VFLLRLDGLGKIYEFFYGVGKRGYWKRRKLSRSIMFDISWKRQSSLNKLPMTDWTYLLLLNCIDVTTNG